MSETNPVIVVTGANSGVGFGICRRLLLQLAQTTPPDAKPQFSPLDSQGHAQSPHFELQPCGGLTVILACRNETRALAARQQLLDDLDEHIRKERRRTGYDGHAERFRSNLEIAFHAIDLSDLRSVFRFGRELSQKYPYISHLICNAGGAVFEGIDWLGALIQIIRQPVIGVTVTEFKIQQSGVIGTDGLGLVWQSNVFSHYVLFRILEPLFTSYAAKCGQPSRVLWMSSLEASSTAFSREDWQCTKARKAYEATKYQIDLLSHELYLRNVRSAQPAVVRHITVHPGISHSDLTKALIVSVLEYAKLAFFYLVRWFGSRNHTITTAAAAVSTVHLALVSLLFVPDKLSNFTHTRFLSRLHPPTLLEDSMYTHTLYKTGQKTAANCEAAEALGKPSPIKFSSEVDRLGSARVGVYTVIDWEEHADDGAFIVEKCEGLYQTCRKLDSEGRLSDLPHVVPSLDFVNGVPASGHGAHHGNGLNR